MKVLPPYLTTNHGSSRITSLTRKCTQLDGTNGLTHMDMFWLPRRGAKSFQELHVGWNMLDGVY